MGTVVMDKKKTAGFLLIELLLALALLLLLVPVFFGVMAAGLKALSLSEKKTVALYLAREGLEEVKEKGFYHPVPSGKQPVEGFAGFAREVAVKEVAAGEGMQPLREIRVTVFIEEYAAEISLVSRQVRR
jgi:type II secretory pathway pseudopilin PulG